MLTLLILDHNLVFGVDPPSDRLKFINHIPKNILMHEFAALNISLKSPNKLSFQFSEEFNFGWLKHFTGNEYKLAYPYLYAYYSHLNPDEGVTPIFFSRAQLLFAFQEIVEKHNCPNDIHYEMQFKDWYCIMKYLISVNSVVTAYEKSSKLAGMNGIQHLNSGLATLNELNIIVNPILSFNRYCKLVEFFLRDKEIRQHTINYFTHHLQCSPEYYLYKIVGLFTGNSFFHHTTEHPHYFLIDPNDLSTINFLNFLSLIYNKSADHNFAFIEIKKSPFFKETPNEFVLLDHLFLVDKIYESFSNDFFFDYLKQNGANEKHFGGIKGRFFEQYISGIFKEIYTNRKDITLKMLDELKDKNKHELCDLYLREKLNVILCQIKGSAISNEQRKGHTESLYGENLDGYYDKYGLLQLIQTIKDFVRRKPEFEIGLAENEIYSVFPVLILNEKIFCTPIMQMAFQAKLSDALQNEQLGNLNMLPITLMHVSDVENFKNCLASKKYSIWDLLCSSHFNWLSRPFYLTYEEWKKKYMTPPFYVNLNYLKIKAEANRAFIDYMINDSLVIKENKIAEQREV